MTLAGSTKVVLLLIACFVPALLLYVDNIPKFATNSSSLDTSLALATGTHSVVAQAWDSTGAVFKTPLTIHVQ